jgi:hypothetical protein
VTNLVAQRGWHCSSQNGEKSDFDKLVGSQQGRSGWGARRGVRASIVLIGVV